MRRGNVLSQVEAELGRIAGHRCSVVLGRWRRCQPVLDVPDLGSLGELPAWVWGLENGQADRLMRSLVAMAQAGDQAAVLLVVACLRPGVCALARRMRVGVDEVVAELTLVVLGFPLDRRESVTGQLLLDTRLRLFRQAQKVRKERDCIVDDGADVLGQIESTKGPVLHRTALEKLAAYVLDARQRDRLTDDAARVILETRVAGDPVSVAAARRGISRKALLQRRLRAEALLVAGER